MRFAISKYKNRHVIVPDLMLTKNEHSASLSEIEELFNSSPDETFMYSSALQSFLQGKSLLLSEIPFSLQEIHEHYLHGYTSYNRGVYQGKCNRCGNNNPMLIATFPCAKCQRNCTYCRKCIMMGRVSECSPLIMWTGPTLNFSTLIPTFNWSGKLSIQQESAANEVKNAMRNQTELLVWAVCGSGKTEVLFHGLYDALKNGKRVCITTPRTDVVHELTPRLKKVFTATMISSLYGGSQDRATNGQFIISTTHQLLRYKNCFDVIVIDEVDAFPYTIDETLQYAMQQARKDHSSLIYLTATPTPKLQKQIHKKTLPVYIIPARYHRKALPVPQFRWCGNWQKQINKHKIPYPIKRWAQSKLEMNKQAFLFIPTIKLLEKSAPLFKKIHPNIEAVSSEDPDRREKVTAFREGKIPILLTTTILERGVTVPNIDVAVMGSEDAVFTESALVQISGRVGRSAIYPTGEIIFFHYGLTNAMVRAKKQIMMMNKKAQADGLIDV